MEEFDIDIVHHPRRRHGNVDGLTRAYEGVGDVSKDDEFPNVGIMTINVEEMPKEYRKIIQYLDGMRFPIEATKVVWTWIAHKSQNYSIISNLLYFQGRDWHAPKSQVNPKLGLGHSNCRISGIRGTLLVSNTKRGWEGRAESFKIK